MYYTMEQMRDTIIGKKKWRRCETCGATGYENWNEDGYDIRSGRTNDAKRCEGECEACSGLGFIEGYI